MLMDVDLFVVKSESQKQRLANSTGHMVKSFILSFVCHL